MTNKKTIPVTVLSGFLGAGKTTLLNHWLQQAAIADTALKLAVIVNDRRRPLPELLFEQVECADLLVLNKCDLSDDESLRQLEASLRDLNPRAQRVVTRHGKLSLDWLTNAPLFDIDATLSAARWRRDIILHLEFGRQTSPHGLSNASTDWASNLSMSTVKHHSDYGLETFLFAARQPFHEAAFFKLMRQGLPGLLRAKGFFWTEARPDNVGLLSIAGDT